MTACVSWLKLEQHYLGERPELAEHVAGCAACQRRLSSIEHDTRPLPRLPAVSTEPWWRRWSLPGLVAPALAAAALALLVLPSEPPPAHTTWKGGELSLSVVGEDGAEVTSFREGDRLKVLLTVVPGARPWRLLVFQGGALFEPLEAGTTSGGNRAPLPGAFRLTGPGDATVCVVVDEQATVERPEDLGSGAVCQGLAYRPE